MASSTNVSIAVPEWNVSLLAGALLSEPTGTDDGTQATFELQMNVVDLNKMFGWAPEGSTYTAVFTAEADGIFKNCCKRQLYTYDGSTLLDRSTVEPSLATHFTLVKSNLITSNSIGAITGCNMVEEKILAVSYDLYNSTSAFTLFDPKSRMLLSQDYYTRGVNALDYIAGKMEPVNTSIASYIVNRIISVRDVNMREQTFSAFRSGDELTFNVIAVSSKSQYDILQNANVDKNLSDRAYKFKIVATDATGVPVYTAGSTTTNIVVPVDLSTINVMGHANPTEYSTIFSKLTSELAVYSTDTSSKFHYIDQFNTTYTTSYSTSGSLLPDGITKQF